MDRRYQPKSNPGVLTAREIEVLRHLLYRLSDLEIAHGLGVSIHTVKFHKKNIYQKWGVTSRSAAITVFQKKMRSFTGEDQSLLNPAKFAHYWMWHAGERAIGAGCDTAR